MKPLIKPSSFLALQLCLIKSLLLSILLSTRSTWSQECTLTNVCGPGFCSSECGPGSACPLPSGHDCPGMMVRLYEQWSDYCDCCPPTCLVYLEEGQRCESVQHYPSSVCGPGLSCRTDSTSGELHCLPIMTPCLDALNEYESKLLSGDLGIHEIRPDCDSEGNYEPIQCDYKACSCVDEERGEPIFGVQHIEQEHMEQDCSCSRRHRTLKVLGCRMQIQFKGDEKIYESELEQCLSDENSNFFESSMRCLPNGNFDSIQCINEVPEVIEPRCGCVEQQLDEDKSLSWNGTLSFRSTTSDLSCYDPEHSYHMPHYFRPCEHLLHQIDHPHQYNFDDNHHEDNEELLKLSGALRPICSPDGFFAEKQARIDPEKEGDIEYFCADREGEPISPEYAAPTREALDCRCARLRSVLPESLEKPVCCPDGSFRSFQCVSGGYCFCVDEFGRQTQKEVSVIDINQLQCRTGSC